MQGPTPTFEMAAGKEESVSALQELIRRVKAGEVTCAALRVYKHDGTWEDVVVGGDSDEERAEALASLHAGLKRAN